MKRAIVQAKMVLPQRHPQSGQIVGQKEEVVLRVFEVDTSLETIMHWLARKSEDAAHFTVNFETEDPDEIALV